MPIRPVALALTTLGLLAGCGRGGESGDSSGTPIVVVWTTDTLGLAAARATDFCGRLDAILARHGLAGACLGGAVSPSSWTGEAHTRLLWPTHRVGSRRSAMEPECGEESVLAELARRDGSDLFFAADNAILGRGQSERCITTSTWHQDADHHWESDDNGAVLAVVPEAERPVHFAIDAVLDETADGKGAVVFLNSFEVGGHWPRCWTDPSTPACRTLWDFAVEAGLFPADADDAARREAFLGYEMRSELTAWAEEQPESRVSAPFWDSMIQAIETWRGPMLEDRLERLLAGLEAQGRLDDLTLVIVGDHGENPCVSRPLAAKSCHHGGLATEWTAIVPAYVAPAALAEEWQASGLVGSDDEPWSTVNLAHALVDDEPAGWPLPEPVGTATTWTCVVGGGIGTGVRVVGSDSLRCVADRCTPMPWGVLPVDDPLWRPRAYSEVPPSLASWSEDEFTRYCLEGR